jgi:replicative DNA helicase
MSSSNLDAEKSVLGGILVNHSQLELARGVVRTEDFFRVAHQKIFDACLVLSGRKITPDMITVSDYLTQSGDLEDCGGMAYISRLTDGVPSSLNVPYYARTVKEHAVRRELLAATVTIADAVKSAEDVQAVIDGAESAIAAVAMQQPTDLQQGTTLALEASAWLEDVAARKSAGRMSGLTTGLQELDRLTDGFQPGDLIVIGARPSQGKTALAMQFALACEGKTAFFSLEMRRAQLSIRALAWLARVDGWALRTGRCTGLEYERVSKAMTQLSESGLAIDDASELTTWQIRSKARRWKAEHGLSLVVVDYLQLLTPSATKRQQRNREQEVAQMSRALKGLAKDVQVPVIVLAQLNRGVESRADAVPKLSDLRESGAVEQDADLVMFLHRPNGASVKDEGEAQILIAKHRNGPTGMVRTTWRPSMTRFDPFTEDMPYGVSA